MSKRENSGERHTRFRNVVPPENLIDSFYLVYSYCSEFAVVVNEL
jgi:hypothetical protein